MKRLNSVTPTEAMIADIRAKSLPGRVYNLSAGDPDLPPCDALKEAYYSSNLNTTHRYCSSAGLPALREKLWKNTDEVIISNGAKQLIYMSLSAVTQPGNEVVIIGPCWTSYMRICSLLGLRFNLLTGAAENRYIPDISQIKAAVTKNTAAVLMNTPNNPTGAVYPDEFVHEVLDVVRANDSRLITDEIYRYISDVPFHTLRGEKDVIVIDGFSKSLSVTGWRLGYAIASKEIIDAMIGIQSQMSGPPGTLMQSILLSAFDTLRYSTFDDYRERVDVLCDIPKFSAARPQGGFYFYVPICSNWESSAALCEKMLMQHSIALTPGDDYGVARTVRISVASEPVEALREIKELLTEI